MDGSSTLQICLDDLTLLVTVLVLTVTAEVLCLGHLEYGASQAIYNQG